MLSKEIVRSIQILLLLILIGSIFMVFAAISNNSKMNRLQNDGVMVVGTILKSGVRDKPQGVKTHFLEVEFRKLDGSLVQKNFFVDQDDHDHAIIIDSIPITYVPDYPGLSSVGKYYGYAREPLYYAIIASFFSLIIIISLELIFRKELSISD